MRVVNFVTNRPLAAGGFGPPPPCGADDILTYGVAKVAEMADPGRSGALAGGAAVAGAVHCGPGGADLPLVQFLSRIIAEAGRAGQTPLISVHGYSYSFEQAVIRTADVCAWLEAGDFPVALAPILFTWPSVDGLSSDNYLGDRDRAQHSGTAMARFLAAFAFAWRNAGMPRSHFLAHSMGAWASQNGMLALAAMPGLNLPADLFEQAIVIAGDADTNALEAGQGFDQLARLAQWLTIGVNRTDFATDVASPSILKRPRLGATGPANIGRIPDNARIVDYTLAVTADPVETPPGETTWNWKLHQYYRTIAAVRDDLGAALSGGDPDQIEGRFTSEAMKAAGQPAIKPGRLYLCPAVAPAARMSPDMALHG